MSNGKTPTLIIRKYVVLIFLDDDLEYWMITLLLGTSYGLTDLSYAQKKVRGDGYISSKEAETRVIPVALNRAKVLDVGRCQVLCDAMEAIQVINDNKD